MASRDYATVTEARGDRITREALDMMWTRYAFAARYCAGRDVLEVACGAGQGLGALRARARRVVGGDFTESLLGMARAQYGGGIPLTRLDGQVLPFRDATFDVVILHEALYYLADAAAFVAEARRVLRPGGHLVIGTVNREWADFNPSPLSTRYYGAEELRTLLRAASFEPVIYAAFPLDRTTGASRVVSAVKRVAVSLGVMPKTMRGKRFLKRVFLGPLVDFPSQIQDGMASYREPVPLGPGAPAVLYKVLYAVGAA
jgi:ubiquinone/menaquinone biosynthesis C-methylase UbiE